MKSQGAQDPGTQSRASTLGVRKGRLCKDGKLTLSQRSQISFMPSATGIRSFMLNFWPEMFTSGVTSHPGKINLITEMHKRDPKCTQ